MLEYGTVRHLHGQIPGQAQRRFAVPAALQPVLLTNTRANLPVGVCLATQGGSRKLSQAARDYAAGMCMRACARAGDIGIISCVRLPLTQVCERGLMKMI